MSNREQQIKFIKSLLDRFSDFVSDSMQDGMHELPEFKDNHFAFLKLALESFEELEESENDIHELGSQHKVNNN